MKTEASLVLTDSQAAALAACYRYIISLSAQRRRKEETANGAQVGDQEPSAASDPGTEPETEVL